MTIGSEIDDYECTVRKAKDGVGWIAEFPDVPGVSVQATTKAEALADAESVLSDWLRHARELGLTIPKPGEAKSATGEFKLRLPRSLHASLVDVASVLELSLNEFNTRLLTAAAARSISGNDASIRCFQIEAGHQWKALPFRPTHERSGVFVQRTSRTVHLQLQKLAEFEGVSLNALAIQFLSFEMGALLALRGENVGKTAMLAA